MLSPENSLKMQKGKESCCQLQNIYVRAPLQVTFTPLLRHTPPPPPPSREDCHLSLWLPCVQVEVLMKRMWGETAAVTKVLGLACSDVWLSFLCICLVSDTGVFGWASAGMAWATISRVVLLLLLLWASPRVSREPHSAECDPPEASFIALRIDPILSEVGQADIVTEFRARPM